MASHTRIDAWQVAVALTLGRIYSLLTYVPDRGSMPEGGSVLVSYLISLALTALLIWPALRLLHRFEGQSLLDVAHELWGRGAWVVAVAVWVASMLAAVGTIGGFEFLMTSGVYNTVAPAFLIVTMLLVCLYAVCMGIEPLMRVSSAVFVAMLISFLFVGIALIPQYDWVYLRAPQLDMFGQIFETALRVTAGDLELLVFLMVVQHLRHGHRKAFWVWQLGSTLLYILLATAATTAMGDYARTQTFPFYALTTIAELSIFQRLDVLHTALWVFLAFIKATLFLYVAGKCAAFLFPRVKQLIIHTVDVVLVGILAGLLTLRAGLFDLIAAVTTTGAPILITVAAVPTALLLTAVIRKRREDR